MSAYELVLLRFDTPVHFGAAGEGGGLERIQSVCQADTFFSALCQEAVSIDPALIGRLAEGAAAGRIRLSNLLPWHQTSKGEYHLYLPRPLLSVKADQEKSALSFAEAKASSKERKALKKRAFIRASEMGQYMEDLKKGQNTISPEPSFGMASDAVHFNGRTRTPYTVGAWHFAPDAGLYTVFALEEEADWDWIEPLVTSLGYTGIGGRRSSGMGKFHADDDPVLLSEDPIYGKDDTTLYAMLRDHQAKQQMALCPVLPEQRDIPAAAAGTGKIIRRGGFASSSLMKGSARMSSVYMMTAGSCFEKRIAGRIADVNNGTAPHPIYRYGKGLYVGLP